MIGLVFGYALIGVVAAVLVGTAITDGVLNYPRETWPALSLLSFVAWVLVLAALAIFGAFLGARAIARSFRALWRHLRGPRIPRAVAREVPR